MSSKLKKRPEIIIASLVLMYLLIHLPMIKTHIYTDTNYSSRQSFEDRLIKIGDYTYYLHGALSIFDFEIEKKFNDKKQPILPQHRRILKTDMPWYAPYVLIFYPYPSFKFGYSLTAAFLTAPFPDKLFQYHIHRLVFVNIIFISLTLVLIFLILRRLTDNDIIPIFACLFFIFDVLNAYNSYWYQSHTISGMFYFILAYYLFVKSENITPVKFGIIAFLLVFSIFSSSHIVLLSALTGLFIYISLCYKEHMTRIFRYTVAGIVGCSILPLYIKGVEKLFKFKTRGLPTFTAQIENYRVTVNSLIETYPLHLRFMWDIRLFNLFIVTIFCITLLIVIYHKYIVKATEVLDSSNRRGMINNKKSFILFLSIVIATIMTAFYTQPVSRGMVPYTVLWGIWLGLFLGKKFVSGDKIIKGLVGIINLLLFFNFYLMFNVIRLPENKPSNNILVIDESEAVSKNTEIFFKTYRAGTYEYKMISRSIGEFIGTYDSQIKESGNTYIKFDAMDLVTTYTPTRRFIERFVPNKDDVVKQETFLKDFRLIAEIFNLYKKDILNDSDIIRRGKTIWDLRLWDQEYNYIYGYFHHVNNFFKGTPLESLDTHCVYYINYRALKNAFLKHRGEERIEIVKADNEK